MQVRRRFMQIGVPLQMENVLQCSHSGGCAAVFALYVQTSGHKCRRVQTSVVHTNHRRVLPIRRKTFNLSALCTFACNRLIII